MKEKTVPSFATGFFIFGLTLIMLFTSCSGEKSDNNSGIGDIEELLDKAAAQQASDDRIAQIYFLDSALAGKTLTIKEQARVFAYKSDIYNNQLHQYGNAMIYADSLMLLVDNIDQEKYKTEHALANYSKGDVLFNTKDYSKAYEYYYKARLIGNTSLDSCSLSEYNFRLALILYRQGRFSEAAESFIRTFNESVSCSFDFPRYFRQQQVLNNVGLSFFKAGNNDSALHYYNKAIKFISENRTKFPDRQFMNDVAMGVIYGNISDVHKNNGDITLAKKLLRQSISINNQKGYDNMDAQYSQVKLADIYFDEGKVDSVYIVLTALRKGLDTVSNTRAEMDWNRLMWKFHNRKEDARKAYGHLMNFTVLRDSLEKESNQLKSADLSQQIKLLENQYEIQALQKDNELKNVYLWIFILAVALALVIVGFVFRNLNRSKKDVKLLQSLNKQVNDQKLQLTEALASLEEKNKQQDRILRAVAHDLRGPVATISMLADLVLNEQDLASRAEMIGFIKTSCNNCLDLIAEILEAADQSNRKEQEKESTNINHLIKTTVELLQLKASEKDQTIITQLPNKDVYLIVNPEKIKRVINNLITNAIKFSPKGEEIRIGLQKEPHANLITVKDNGIGIPHNIQSRVFDMFTEAKRKGTAGELPYGLGLSICKQIVEAHNGSIWFESKQDEGTTFFVALP
jgi:two-component system, OmpR family, sensor histidine kinase VicK